MSAGEQGNKQERTAGPWKIADDLQEHYHVVVSETCHCGVARSEDYEDAEFIVQACNSFDALVSALEDAEFLMRQAGKIAGPMQDSFNRSAADARAALAKAKGE